MEYSIVSGPDKSSLGLVSQGHPYGLNACRPNGNSLAPKIVLSTIDGRSIFRGVLDEIAEEPKTALIPSRLGSGWRGDKERPYCSSTGPRLVSVITDRSLRGSPLMSALQQAARPCSTKREDPDFDPRRKRWWRPASIDLESEIRDRVACLAASFFLFFSFSCAQAQAQNDGALMNHNIPCKIYRCIIDVKNGKLYIFLIGVTMGCCYQKDKKSDEKSDTF